MNKNKKSLLQILRSKSIKHGDFTLSSGKKSRYYIDCKPTLCNAKGAMLIGEIVYDMIIDMPVIAIGGVGMGAALMAMATMMVSTQNTPLNAFIIRKTPKQYGSMNKIEGEIAKGNRVVIIDDVITTGKSIIQAINILENVGVEIVNIICLIDREEGGKENIEKKGYFIKSIFTIMDLIF